MEKETKKDLALDLFRSFQTGRKIKKKIAKENLNSAGDPQLLSQVLSELIENRDWKSGIAEGNLFSLWPTVVGPEVAAHATPISLIDGELTLQTSSTAWAVQLRIIAPDLLDGIQKQAPGVLVDSIAIIGPHAPSWKRGLRTIRGAKGPRDTYG